MARPWPDELGKGQERRVVSLWVTWQTHETFLTFLFFSFQFFFFLSFIFRKANMKEKQVSFTKYGQLVYFLEVYIMFRLKIIKMLTYEDKKTILELWPLAPASKSYYRIVRIGEHHSPQHTARLFVQIPWVGGHFQILRKNSSDIRHHVFR